MFNRDHPKIPDEALARARRWMVAFAILGVALTAGQLLWESSRSAAGIATLDIVVAILMMLIVLSAMYAGWRIGLKRLAELHRKNAN